jgi:hypothetical protein
MYCSFGPKSAGPNQKQWSSCSSVTVAVAGQLIPVVTGGKVGRGGVLGLHGAVGKRLEAHWRGGLNGGAVSTGAQLGQRGTAVMGGVWWWWSVSRSSERWPGYGRSLGWRR